MRAAPSVAPEGAGGFPDPVRDAARAFRTLLAAMARPGRVAAIAPAPAPPAPLSPAAAAVLLTLADADAPVWLPEALRGGPVEAWLRFESGAAPAAATEGAAFAYGRWEDVAAVLRGLPAGTPAYPDRSATLVLEVAALTEGAGPRLTGPGIETEARLGCHPPDDFWRERAAHAFPLGRDILFCAGDRVAALPRSTRVEV